MSPLVEQAILIGLIGVPILAMLYAGARRKKHR